MEDSVRFWVDSSVQLVLLTVDSARFLIDCDSIQGFTVSGL